MRGALVGYGTIAVGHHEAYLSSDHLQIIAVADPSEARRREARRRDDSVSLYGSMRELFTEERLDFVDICTPPSCHLEQILAALDYGCHALCEKPFLLAPEDFYHLSRRLAASNTVVYPSHNYKFSPVFRKIKQLLDSGEIGEIVRGYFRIMRVGHARGVQAWNPDWRRDPTISGGGILQDHATHAVYLASMLCGAPASVYCLLGNLAPKGFSETEDTALVVLEFHEGTEVSIDLTWAAARRNTSYTVMGTRQNVVIDNDEMLLTHGGITSRHTLISEFDDPNHAGWFGAMLEDFVASLADTGKQRSLLEEAWTTCATIAAAYRSARLCGQPIPIPNFLFEEP